MGSHNTNRLRFRSTSILKLLLSMLAMFASKNVSAQDYVFETFSHFPYMQTHVRGINDDGVVVGYYENRYMKGSNPTPEFNILDTDWHWFAYTHGGFREMKGPSFLNGSAAYPIAISNKGQVLVLCTAPVGGSYFIYDLAKGTYSPISLNGRTKSSPIRLLVITGLNDRGEIVGLAGGATFVGTPAIGAPGSMSPPAALGTFTQIPGPPGMGPLTPTGINGEGQISFTCAVGGCSYLHTNNPTGSSAYSEGTFAAVLNRGAVSTNANAVNAAGVVAGWYQPRDPGPGTRRAFAYNGSAFTTLVLPKSQGDDIESAEAFSINNKGQIAGEFRDPHGSLATGFIATPRAAVNPDEKSLGGMASQGESGTEILSATYGGNCGAKNGNATASLAAACGGAGLCTYVINTSLIGDPHFGCAKDYVAHYRCRPNQQAKTVGAGAEAGNGSAIILDCDSQKVPTGAQSAPLEPKGSDQQHPSAVAPPNSEKGDALIDLIRRNIGADAAQTLTQWRNLKSEPPPVMFNTNPDITTYANNERQAVEAGLERLFARQLLLDISKARMERRDNALEALKGIVGQKVTLGTRGRNGVRNYDEDVDAAVLDLADFNQEDSVAAAVGLGVRIDMVVKPIVETSAASTSKAIRANTGPLRASPNSASPLKFNELVRLIEQVGPDAAETLTIWHELKQEAPPPMFRTFPEITVSVYGDQQAMVGGLEIVFGTQLLMDISKSNREGRAGLMEALKAALQPQTGEDLAKIVGDLGGFRQGDARSDSSGKTIRAMITRTIRPILEQGAGN